MQRLTVLVGTTAVYLTLFAGFLYTIVPFFSPNFDSAEISAPLQHSIEARKSNQPQLLQLPNAQSLDRFEQIAPFDRQFANDSRAAFTVGQEAAYAEVRPLTTPRPPVSLAPEEIRPLPTPVSGETESTPNSPQFGYLIIPSLNVNHRVTAVPVVQGNWDISQLDSQVGHLQTTGTHPSDDLAMTFVAHVSVPWPSPAPAPFADLILLKHGEQIIYRWNGFDYIYEVSRIFRVDPAAVELLYHDNPTSIQLATCSGWSVLNRNYGERLITRATLVKVEPHSHQ